MINTLLQGWNLMRLLRLALGIFILGDGIDQGEGLFIAAGILFTLMPILNVGCCGVSSSCTNSYNEKTKSDKEITYEEVH